AFAVGTGKQRVEFFRWPRRLDLSRDLKRGGCRGDLDGCSDRAARGRLQAIKVPARVNIGFELGLQLITGLEIRRRFDRQTPPGRLLSYEAQRRDQNYE